MVYSTWLPRHFSTNTIDILFESASRDGLGRYVEGISDRKLCDCGDGNCYQSSGEIFDEGYFRNETAGIVKILLRTSSVNETTKRLLTLGPLECEGEDGNSLHHTYTVKSLYAGLWLHNEWSSMPRDGGLRQFEFSFRTHQANIMQLASGICNSSAMELSLQEGV